jgi:transposase
MIRQASKVWLSGEERDELERFACSRTLPVRCVERASIILDVPPVMTTSRWGQELGVCRQTVGRWRERFVAQGMEGLEDRPRSGRPARIQRARIDEIVRLTTQEKPMVATHWSTRVLAEVTGVSAATVGRIWRAHGLKPHRVKSFKLSNDARFAEKLEDVVNLYLHPPAGALVIAVDERCQIQALERTQPCP